MNTFWWYNFVVQMMMICTKWSILTRTQLVDCCYSIRKYIHLACFSLTMQGLAHGQRFSENNHAEHAHTHAHTLTLVWIVQSIRLISIQPIDQINQRFSKPSHCYLYNIQWFNPLLWHTKWIQERAQMDSQLLLNTSRDLSVSSD